jgi:hypothetical protein
LKFVDVTSQSGIDVRSYGMGVASADYDNDGWVDLYLFGSTIALAGSAMPHCWPALPSAPAAGQKAAWASMPATSTTMATTISW